VRQGRQEKSVLYPDFTNRSDQNPTRTSRNQTGKIPLASGFPESPGLKLKALSYPGDSANPDTTKSFLLFCKDITCNRLTRSFVHFLA
jgi:hypothetical protein